MTRKPDECKTCPMYGCSTGFVPDAVPQDPWLWIVMKMPGKEETWHGEPLVGATGRFMNKNLLEPLGIPRERVGITNVIRCYPASKDFPVGMVKKTAVENCRRYDAALKAYRPDCFGVTFNLAALLRTPQVIGFVENAFRRALRLRELGHRPVLLMGEEAKECYAPHLKGAIKKWQGHWEALLEDNL